MKKYILFSVICVVVCWSNSFAQYPDWINYTSGQGICALANNGKDMTPIFRTSFKANFR